MKIIQEQITLKPRSRGFHLITSDVIDKIDLSEIETGMLQVHILHTSASLTINENADPTVREDFNEFFNRLVPESDTYYKHTLEGPDDMTSHIKSSVLGSSVLIPIKSGRPLLGTWQGIYLCEHRNNGGSRRLVATAWGV